MQRPYRGRLAPTPTGYFHLGHASTFWMAQRRAEEQGGALVLRVEDLDRARCQRPFVEAMFEDFAWLGLRWHEGPDVGGPYGPYTQSERQGVYLDFWRRLHATGWIYPSPHSRQEINTALLAPHEEDEREPIFPVHLRPPLGTGAEALLPGEMNWRFRVPDGRTIAFDDQRLGHTARTAGKDFGDFLVWRKDGFPSYELAVVVDDLLMRISEVVRGEDLLTSTARQLLLYEAFAAEPPAFYHCPLVRDADGKRLAKRSGALGLRELRAAGRAPAEVRECIEFRGGIAW